MAGSVTEPLCTPLCPSSFRPPLLQRPSEGARLGLGSHLAPGGSCSAEAHIGREPTSLPRGADAALHWCGLMGPWPGSISGERQLHEPGAALLASSETSQSFTSHQMMTAGVAMGCPKAPSLPPSCSATCSCPHPDRAPYPHKGRPMGFGWAGWEHGLQNIPGREGPGSLICY